MIQDWWKQWSRELQSLQSRQKWDCKKENVSVGDVVLISDETMPPAKQPLAKVVKDYHGPDGLVRVVDLKTGSTQLKRPIHKLVKLNILNNEEEILLMSKMNHVKNVLNFVCFLVILLFI